MNLVIDIGNSRSKAGIFDAGKLVHKETFNSLEDLRHFLSQTDAEHLLVCSVGADINEVTSWSRVTGKKLNLHPGLSVPIENLYKSPTTLGADRLAAACGAWVLFPNRHSLVIDAGTCINYEFVRNDGKYLGGAISPGIMMRFEAMHKITSRLPLASPVSSALLTGMTTEECLQSGVMNGTLEEIKGTILRYQNQYPGTGVILCGGDSHFFENHLKPSIFVAPDLVLVGLNSILLQNVIP